MRLAIFALLLVALSACSEVATPDLGPVTRDALPVCYNSNCRDTQVVTLSRAEWREIQSLFRKIRTPRDERIAIRAAVGRLETLVGRQTPTHRDLARNRNPQGEDGRMDCVDESLNTTTYLALMQQEGLLRFHDVTSRGFRSHYAFDQHYAARIANRETGEIYAVDSWHGPNGAPPIMQPYREWLLKRSPPRAENPV